MVSLYIYIYLFFACMTPINTCMFRFKVAQRWGEYESQHSQMYESFTCLQPKHLAGWHVQTQAVWQGKESQNMPGAWHTPLNRLFIINISLIYCHLVHDFELCACPFDIKMHSFLINWTKHVLNQWPIDITKYNPNYNPVLLHFSNFWGQSPEAFWASLQFTSASSQVTGLARAPQGLRVHLTVFPLHPVRCHCSR